MGSPVEKIHSYTGENLNISLDEVTQLVQVLLSNKRLLEQKAKELSAVGDRVKFIEDTLLPSTLREVNLLKFTLSDGSVISVEPNISVAITEEHWPAAEKWLVDNQRDGIIKNQVITEFDKGQNEAAERIGRIITNLTWRPLFVDFILNIIDNEEADGAMCIDREELLAVMEFQVAAVKSKKAVHPQTLKAEMRKCMATGVEIPEETFSLFITDHTKISPPK